jgi:hypothetical protein
VARPAAETEFEVDIPPLGDLAPDIEDAPPLLLIDMAEEPEYPDLTEPAAAPAPPKQRKAPAPAAKATSPASSPDLPAAPKPRARPAAAGGQKTQPAGAGAAPRPAAGSAGIRRPSVQPQPQRPEPKPRPGPVRRKQPATPTAEMEATAAAKPSRSDEEEYHREQKELEERANAKARAEVEAQSKARSQLQRYAREAKEAQEKKARIQAEHDPEEVAERRKKLLIQVGIGAAVLVLGYFAWDYFKPAPRFEGPMQADKVWQEYNTDQAAADKKYASKQQVLIGKLAIESKKGKQEIYFVPPETRNPPLRIECANFIDVGDMGELQKMGTPMVQIAGEIQPYDGGPAIKVKDCIFMSLLGQ